MCAAAATLLPEFSMADIASAVVGLHQRIEELGGVYKDGNNHERLDAARLPLSHVIYVERTTRGTYGIVQFFGALQFNCTLGKNSQGPIGAILGVLDTLTGEETFRETTPLLPFHAPHSSPAFAESWARRLAHQLHQRGFTDFGDVQITHKPVSRLISSGSTTDTWPFAQLPPELRKG